MCGKIDCFQQAFAKLNTDKNKNRWSAQTSSRAPHKPFLLLSILDLIAQQIITKDFIEPSFELAQTFSEYWNLVMPIGSSGNMAYPFFHMDSEPFWDLIPIPGVSQPKGRVISSMKRIRELYLGARIDRALFPLLLMEPLREKLRKTLIEAYFAPEVREVLIKQGQINIEAYKYSKNLLENCKTCEPSPSNVPEVFKHARNQGFRKAIVTLYKHRCALSGIRMLTPDGHTVVEAAHVVPWSETKNDLPTNGIALCRLCHWSFDEGLMSVGKNYEVLISAQVKREPNFPGHMLTLSERPIFRPSVSSQWPDQQNLIWHRAKVLRK